MKSIGQIFIFCILETFTERIFLTFCLLFPGLQTFAQISEHFSDNELMVNPLWVGQTADFSVDSGVLQLTAPAESTTSYISTVMSPSPTMSWQCKFTLDFNPSSSNYCRLYLLSDSSVLTGSLNGYYVMVGNATDEISLYKQSGAVKTKIIDGADGRVNSELVSATLKVTRSAEGKWMLSSRKDDETDFLVEGEATDLQFSDGSYAGIACNYTATRSDKFFFDDFVVTTADEEQLPFISKLEIAAANELHIYYSHPIEPLSQQTLEHYLVNNGIGAPANITPLNANREALLRFSAEFEPMKTNLLFVRDLKTVSGSVITDTVAFTYIPVVNASFKDVVISEFLADPDPAGSLPDCEFVELLNRSSQPLDLSGWHISDGNTNAGIGEEAIILPGEYLLLTNADHLSKLSPYGRVIGLKNFPSLNNSADFIIVRDRNNELIDSIHYSDSWYRDTEKKDGGWTLEIIDPDNFCAQESNWLASESAEGGTPGKINSVDAENIDLTAPELVVAYVIAPDTVRLIFNERLSSSSHTNTNFVLSPEKEIVYTAPNAALTQIDLAVNPPITPGEKIALTLQNIFDCSGNALASAFHSTSIVLPQPADSLDVVLNEILFNPRTSGVDFVEVYNNSDKHIDLKGWAFANMDEETSNVRRIDDALVLLPPSGFLAFCVDPIKLASEYPKAPSINIVKLDLPPMNDDAGSIALINPEGKVMDLLHYSREMHSIFLKDDEGVSLERISASSKTQDAANWKSASTQVDYATPGSVNSNSISVEPVEEGEVSVMPEVFVPLVGQPDFASIVYEFNSSGYMGSVRIYDQQGRTVKTVAENILFGASGLLRWEGDRDDGTKAPVGNYMILLELVSDAGELKRIRKRVAIGGNF
jgi:hypothetical protein